MLSRIGDALVAASYPLLGISTVLRNTEYWPLFSHYLSSLCFNAIFVHIYLFRFALFPQFTFLAHYLHHGSAAWLNAIVLTLAEGLALVQLVSGGYNIDLCRAEAFDVRVLTLSGFILLANCFILPANQHTRSRRH